MLGSMRKESLQPGPQKKWVMPSSSADGAVAVTDTLIPQTGSTASAEAQIPPEDSSRSRFLCATRSARTAIPISSWLQGPRSTPTGVTTRASSSAGTPALSSESLTCSPRRRLATSPM